jgi:xanthine dehydrogenase accessory factor
MMIDLMETWLEARRNRRPCALATVAAASGSVPREAGAKMLIHPDGSTFGTIGGGRFEALVIADALQSLQSGAPVLKTYPLHEGRDDSFGAICGGEVTVLIEPPPPCPRLTLVGAGHCARAIAHLAATCGFRITVIDDREDLTRRETFPEADHLVTDESMTAYLAGREWTSEDAVVLVNRSHGLDKEALRVLLPCAQTIGYLGMIGSRRKVRRVFDELKADGSPVLPEHRVFAPIGLDLGADTPEEIAVSVLAEILMVRRRASGDPLSVIRP